MSPRMTFEIILTGLKNGRIQQVIELVEDVLKQLPEVDDPQKLKNTQDLKPIRVHEGTPPFKP